MDAPVLGARVAAKGFVEALLRHGEFDRYDLWVHPYELHDAREAIRCIAPARDTAVRSVVELADSRAPAVTAWHDVHGRVRCPFYVRRQFATSAYPISLTHHTISYADQLFGLFLRLLFAAPQPCDSVVCTSEAARNSFRRVVERVREASGIPGPDLRLDVLPLPVDTDVFRPRDRAEVRRSLGLVRDRPILLTLGRVSAADKADLLPALLILRDLVRERPAQKPLWVIGGTARDSEAHVVEDYARALGIWDCVRLIGDCTTKRHLWLAAADVLLAPADSIQETFGLAPVEAMACGTPQVVSDWDGYRDTVDHGVTGFRVPTYWAPYEDALDTLGPLLEEAGLADHLLLGQSVVVDPRTLRQYLATILDDPYLRRRMGAESRRRAEERFSGPAVIRAHEALWEELSEVARAAEIGAPGPDLDRPSYLDAFAGYASRVLPDDLTVRIADAGVRLVSGLDPLPAYREDIGMISFAALETALRRLAHHEGAETIADFGAALGLGSEGAARRHVLWLLKYGFVELAD